MKSQTIHPINKNAINNFAHGSKRSIETFFSFPFLLPYCRANRLILLKKMYNSLEFLLLKTYAHFRGTGH